MRHCYYFFLKRKINISKMGKARPKRVEKKLDKSLLFSYVDSLGIKNGDILVVHSSMRKLAQFGLSPKEIIDWLLELVGPDGTLCMPAFPSFSSDDYNVDRVTGENVITYDVLKTPCWTGILTNLFLQYPEVIRSEFPYNPLAAIGRHAKSMMKDNLLADKPHGKHSAWEYCVNHNAKFIFLGCPMSHSLTLVHVREDLDEFFPIPDWYIKQKYNIISENTLKEISIWERDQKWSKYFSELFGERNILKKGLASKHIIGSTPITYIPDSSQLKEYWFEKEIADMDYYRVPKKFFFR